MRGKWTIFFALIVFLYGCQPDKKIEQSQTDIEIEVISEATEPETSKIETQGNLTGTLDDSSNQGNSGPKTDETDKPFTDLEEIETLWGTFTPDTAENDYVKEIKKIRTFETGTRTQTYAADYDGNGKQEAFVFCGEYEGSEYVGTLWFVDEDKTAFCIKEDMYAFMEQVYYKDFDQIYLLFSHQIGNPTMTEMYTVKSGEAVNVSEKIPGQKWVDENGYIIVVQDSYDIYYDREAGAAEGLWTGHAWKFYPFYFLNGEFTEVKARETNLETMDKMAPVPEDVRTRLTDMPDKHVAATQFIYRERTREMILNIAYDCSKEDMLSYCFENVIYRLSEDADQVWEFVEENNGIYKIQYTKESFWEVIDGLERTVPEGKE